MRLLKLTDEELQILASLLSSGVKYEGLKCVYNASMLRNKIENAELIEPSEKTTEE